MKVNIITFHLVWQLKFTNIMLNYLNIKHKTKYVFNK